MIVRILLFFQVYPLHTTGTVDFSGDAVVPCVVISGRCSTGAYPRRYESNTDCQAAAAIVAASGAVHSTYTYAAPMSAMNSVVGCKWFGTTASYITSATTEEDCSSSNKCVCRCKAEPISVYRFYNSGVVDHSYSLDPTEPLNYVTERTEFNAFDREASDTVPIYSFWSAPRSDRAYSYVGMADSYVQEGVAFYAYDQQTSGRVTVYRHKLGDQNTFLSTSAVPPTGYVADGIAFYAPKAKTSCVQGQVQDNGPYISTTNSNSESLCAEACYTKSAFAFDYTTNLKWDSCRCVGFGQTSRSDPGDDNRQYCVFTQARYCVLIVTRDGNVDFGGDLLVNINTDGYFVREADGTHASGAVVLDRCYSNPVLAVQVHCKSMNAWIGSIRYSIDSKNTYMDMVCDDCNSGSTSSSGVVVVDGDDNSSPQYTTRCANGMTCTLYQEIHHVAQLVGAGVCANGNGEALTSLATMKNPILYKLSGCLQLAKQCGAKGFNVHLEGYGNVVNPKTSCHIINGDVDPDAACKDLAPGAFCSLDSCQEGTWFKSQFAGTGEITQTSTGGGWQCYRLNKACARKTIEGTGSGPVGAGVPCVFPFIWNAKTYHDCTTDSTITIAWCSTQVDSMGVTVPDNWGECGPSCEVCHCNDLLSSTGEGGANCASMDNGKRWCYVDPGTCADGVDSTDAPVNGIPKQWSFAACEDSCPITRVYDQLECMDGTLCIGTMIGWSCCDNHGGRAKCPPNYPYMCAAKAACVDTFDYCCQAAQTSCDAMGGVRQCVQAVSQHKLLPGCSAAALNADYGMKDRYEDDRQQAAEIICCTQDGSIAYRCTPGDDCHNDMSCFSDSGIADLHTYAAAENVCQTHGLRLCANQAELDTGCTSGCSGIDSTLVWTSAEATYFYGLAIEVKAESPSFYYDGIAWTSLAEYTDDQDNKILKPYFAPGLVGVRIEMNGKGVDFLLEEADKGRSLRELVTSTPVATAPCNDNEWAKINTFTQSATTIPSSGALGIWGITPMGAIEQKYCFPKLVFNFNRPIAANRGSGLHLLRLGLIRDEADCCCCPGSYDGLGMNETAAGTRDYDSVYPWHYYFFVGARVYAMFTTTTSTTSTGQSISGQLGPTTTTIIGTSKTATTLASGLLQCSLTIDVNEVERFLLEPALIPVVTKAAAELLGCNISWIQNLRVEAAPDRRLALSSQSTNHTSDRNVRTLLDLTTRGGVKIEFDVVVPPDGGPEELTATLLVERFEQTSMEEAAEVINKVVQSGALGSTDYEVRIIVKKGKVVQERSNAPSPSSTATAEDSSMVLIIVFIAVAIASLFLMLAVLLLARRYLLRRRKDNGELESLVKSTLEAMDRTDNVLLFPPSKIHTKSKEVIWQSISTMLDNDKPLVFVCFAVGQRTGDDYCCGPGMFFAAAVIQALHARGISCCAYPEVVEKQAEILHRVSSCKLLLLVETHAVYREQKCLEEIHSAVKSKLDIMRLGFERDTPRVGEQWLDVCSENDELAQMRTEVEDVLESHSLSPEAPAIVQSVPDFLETIALDLERKFQATTMMTNLGLQFDESTPIGMSSEQVLHHRPKAITIKKSTRSCPDERSDPESQQNYFSYSTEQSVKTSSSQPPIREAKSDKSPGRKVKKKAVSGESSTSIGSPLERTTRSKEKKVSSSPSSSKKKKAASESEAKAQAVVKIQAAQRGKMVRQRTDREKQEQAAKQVAKDEQA